MREGFLQSSRYSPGNMNRESLEALFVGRQDIMDDVMNRLERSIQHPEKHYLLLVGPRGSGKTHFISLVHHRLMDRLNADDGLDASLVALLNEEEWGVASFLDLVVRVLKALIDQIPILKDEIDTIYDKFSKDPDEAEAFAVALLRHHAQDKTLLLICENLVDLFRGLGDEGQKKLRSTIQEDGNWTIIASTPSLFAALTLQDNPFYGFFTVRLLEKIDFDTALELLSKKATHEKKPELANLLRTPRGRARARAIHHLAAGNHRAYVILFDFLDKESLDDLIEPFMHMVDDLTPYYQDRIRQIPPAQRKIVEFLSHQGEPTTIKEIASQSLMSQQTAAKQISELDTAGFVKRMRFGRNTFCELSEPLMRICIEVKDNKTRYFRLFVEFLRHWFTTRELERRNAALQYSDHASHLDRIHVAEAIRCSHTLRKEPFLDALHEEADRCLQMDDYVGFAKIQETLANDNGEAEDYLLWFHALVKINDTNGVISLGQKVAKLFPQDANIQCELAYAYIMNDEFDKAIVAIDQAIALEGPQTMYLCPRANMLLELGRFEEAIADAQAVLTVEPDHWHSYGQIISALAYLGRNDEAKIRMEELVDRVAGDVSSLFIVSDFLLIEEWFEEAICLLDKVLEIDPDNQTARRMRGNACFQMSDYDRAIDDLQYYASKHPDSISTHCWLADCLLQSGKWDDAAETAKHLIYIDPEHSHAYYVRGHALNKLGRTKDAVLAFDQLLDTRDHASLIYAGSSMRKICNFAVAERYFDRAFELMPDSLELWIEKTKLFLDEGAFDAAAESATRIESLPHGMLLGRLFATQAAAATMPLDLALENLDDFPVSQILDSDEQLHLDAIGGILTVSVRQFGPKFLVTGMTKLRKKLAEIPDEGALGRVLIAFLDMNVDGGFTGALPEWEEALGELSASLSDLPECQIPVQMIQTAVKYIKTGNERHLLSIPLEQRQLLEDVLPTISELLSNHA